MYGDKRKSMRLPLSFHPAMPTLPIRGAKVDVTAFEFFADTGAQLETDNVSGADAALRPLLNFKLISVRNSR